MTLLDNRRKKTPRESMDALIKYARYLFHNRREQDRAIAFRKTKAVRATAIINFVFFGAIATYTFWVFLVCCSNMGSDIGNPFTHVLSSA